MSEQHKAGRALDALVAERVFSTDTTELQWCLEWETIKFDRTYRQRCARCGSERTVYGVTDVKSGPCRIRIPPYSTDDAAAMLVFERAVEMVGCGRISADMEDARGEGFVVSVSFGFDGARATGPLALAICRAALLSLEPIGEESL